VDYGLTEEQQAIIDIAREIGQKKIKPIRMEADEQEKFPWSVVEEMKKVDLFGIYLHPNYGGLGGGGFELVLAVEELSRACGGIALALAASALGAFPIILYGTPAQKKKYLPDIASGKKLAAFCITEPEAGSDATATKATARKEGDYYILNGVKNFCSNGEAAETYTTFLSTNLSRASPVLSSRKARRASASARKNTKWASAPATPTSSPLTIAKSTKTT
jgi:alkylation response protein AidB-like acyl-CoA dehydrogenase